MQDEIAKAAMTRREELVPNRNSRRMASKIAFKKLDRWASRHVADIMGPQGAPNFCFINISSRVHSGHGSDNKDLRPHFPLRFFKKKY